MRINQDNYNRPKTTITDSLQNQEEVEKQLANYEEVSAVGKNAKDFILSNYSEDNFKFSFKKLFDTV